ncbi:MAG: SET domain-containing protein, partial [Methylococcales bacterium]
MLSSAVKVSDSEIEGAGLIAGRFIPAGEILYQFNSDEPPAHRHELIYWPKETRQEFMKFACQIGEDDFCFLQGEIKFINHSCDPSGWWETFGVLTARRDIQSGEEIAYDYSTSDIMLHYSMECMCKSKSCRGTVTEKDYLLPDFQEKYADHLPKHVAQAIQRKKTNEPDPQRGDVSQAPLQVIELARQTLSHAAEFQKKYAD